MSAFPVALRNRFKFIVSHRYHRKRRSIENKCIPFLPSSLNTLLFPKQLDGALSSLINWKPFYELVNKLEKEATNIQSVLKLLIKDILSMTEPLMREDEVEGRWAGYDLIGDLSGRNSR